MNNIIKSAFFTRIFDAANLQRWNDQVRPVDLRELDKQAHKMVVAWAIGKFHENDPEFDWIQIIEGGIFEFLERLFVTDLKPPLFHKIRSNPEAYRSLIDLSVEGAQEIFSPTWVEKFRNYLLDFEKPASINRQILNAAHYYTTREEFDIIYRAYPYGYNIENIKNEIDEQIKKYGNLTGLAQIVLDKKLQDFIKLIGQMRFQIRWSQTHRVPRTSVLGHMLIVAMIGYMLSEETGMCRKRKVNNFYTGLFHDLPEALTRDIINPVKRHILEIVHSYEHEEMEKVYALIPHAWRKDIEMFTRNEFSNRIIKNGKIETFDTDIPLEYNKDEFSARDGKLLKGADRLAAFIEADLALKNGINNPHFERAKKGVLRDYQEHGKINGIDFAKIARATE